MIGTMTPAHPRWREFSDRLDGPEGIDMREGARGDVIWDCVGHTREKTVAILRAMGADADDLSSTLDYMDERGGSCDCEVALNVASEIAVQTGSE